MFFLFSVIAVIITASSPDVLTWTRSRVTARPGSDHIAACARSGDLSSYSVVVLNEVEDRWTWSLLTLDRYGAETGSTLILSDNGSMEHWVTPCFLPGSRLALALGSRLLPGAGELLIMDTGSQEVPATVEITGFPEEYGGIVITSMESLDGEGMMITGAATGGGGFLFTGGLGLDGGVSWCAEVPGFRGRDIEDTTLEVLYDGSFMLGVDLEGFQSCIDILRLDSRGNELWRACPDLEAEFVIKVEDFLELPSGKVLCAVTSDIRGSFRLQGHLFLFDPALNELWNAPHRYRHNTSLTSLEPTEDGGVLIAGWTGSRGERPFEMEGVNAFLAPMDPSGDMRVYIISGEGSQIPVGVFPGGFDEYFVLGEHTPEGEEGSDIFWGQVHIR